MSIKTLSSCFEIDIITMRAIIYENRAKMMKELYCGSQLSIPIELKRCKLLLLKNTWKRIELNKITTEKFMNYIMKYQMYRDCCWHEWDICSEI